MPLLLVDNDVLIKLAHWRLLGELPAAFNETWTSVAALTSLKYRARKAERKLFRDPGAARDLAETLELAGELPEPDPSVYALLQDEPGIDAGEVVLIAGCAGCPESLWITGDKRALLALAQPHLRAAADKVAGRVICLEQMLLRIVNNCGAAHVVSAVRTYHDLDTAVRCAIGTLPAEDQTVSDGLASYIAHLKLQTCGILVQ